MKTKSLILTVIIAIGLITSCQDEMGDLRSDAELIQSLKVDEEFQDFFKEARSAQLSVSEKLIYINSSDELNNVRNSTSLEEVSQYLDLSNNFLTEFDNKSKNITNYLSTRYPELKLKTEEELSLIVQASISLDYQTYDLVLSNLPNARVMDACDDQFEADFNRIHEEYDSGVVTCLVVGAVTGGTGLIPCNAANVYSTTVKLAKAIDDHTLCSLN